MKTEHPFLTSGEDSGFAVLFAISDISSDAAIVEMEKCYEILRHKFFSANAVQSLSHTLALGEGDAIKKCNNAIKIFERLKDRNCKFGPDMELSVLGILALASNNTEKVVNDISETSDYLLTYKGFGAFGMGKTHRIMYSAILVSQEYKKQCSENIINIATVNSVTSIIIAQQAVMAAIIAASAASSTSNN